MKIDNKDVAELNTDLPDGEKASERRHVFVIGSKGIPAAYGGFETFVEQLTSRRKDKQILYHVACMAESDERFLYNGAVCFRINVPQIGPARAVLFDILALEHCIRYVRRNPGIEDPVFYVLACRIGPWAGYFARKIHSLGGRLYVNPDGHEWKRAKWSRPVRRYWKLSEAGMVRHADLLICDSLTIEKYIQHEYSRFTPETMYLSYGSDDTPSGLSDDDTAYLGWLKKNGLKAGEYALIVGRFVPENNFEVMIREYMASHTERPLAIITTANDGLLAELEEKLHFSSDSRIRFVGTIYEEKLLKKIRERAYLYLHGHSVGGTNPSLLEALGSTCVNLLFAVGFNREVAGKTALYWTKEEGDLSQLLDRVESFEPEECALMGQKARARIRAYFGWDRIIGKYEALWRKEI